MADAPSTPTAPATLTLSVEQKKYQMGADVRIVGKGFGKDKGTSLLVIGGHQAEISSWGEELIVAKVPTTLSESEGREVVLAIGDKQGKTTIQLVGDK